MRLSIRQLSRRAVSTAPKRSAAAIQSLNQQVDRYSRYSPSPLSVQQFLDFGQSNSENNEIKSVEYLRYELPTRLANMLKEMNRLPKELLETQSFQNVKNMYEETLNEVLLYEKSDVKNENVRDQFTNSLTSILNRHRSVVELVAHGVMEYKEDVRENGARTIEEEKIQYFLDRFYMSRIAIRVLINQHVSMFGDERRDPALIGAFDPKCDLRKVVEDAAYSAQYLCETYYLGSPEVDFEIINEHEDRDYIEMGYVPSHLHHICFELFKNSMRATVELHGSVDPPPIKILMTKGKDNVCIKISDRGGGASLDECRRWTHYMYSTAPPPPKSDDAQIVPLAGYGYGIPLSRLYARYLGGDLMLQSIEGYGTDCFIYLKSGNNDAVEVLPIFTNQLGEHYKSKKEMKDWVSKAGLISSNQLNTSMRNN
jgi:pyruvate dehydrogenase kinase 2/3/4